MKCLGHLGVSGDGSKIKEDLAAVIAYNLLLFFIFQSTILFVRTTHSRCKFVGLLWSLRIFDSLGAANNPRDIG